MTTKREYEKQIRKEHKENGWEQPYRVIVDDDIYEPYYLFEQCEICGKEFSFVVDEGRYLKWQGRVMLIQDAMPGIAPADREILKTHICGQCWDRMFGLQNRKRFHLGRRP